MSERDLNRVEVLAQVGRVPEDRPPPTGTSRRGSTNVVPRRPASPPIHDVSGPGTLPSPTAAGHIPVLRRRWYFRWSSMEASPRQLPCGCHPRHVTVGRQARTRGTQPFVDDEDRLPSPQPESSRARPEDQAVARPVIRRSTSRRTYPLMRRVRLSPKVPSSSLRTALLMKLRRASSSSTSAISPRPPARSPVAESGGAQKLPLSDWTRCASVRTRTSGASSNDARRAVDSARTSAPVVSNMLPAPFFRFFVPTG